MPKITGNLGVKINGFLRVKINQPILGIVPHVQSFAIADGEINIELPPSPRDTVYLVDFAIAPNDPFNPVEQWTVPSYDIDVDELRDIERTSLRWLESENRRLATEHGEAVSKAKVLTEQLDIESDGRKAAIADLEQLKQDVAELEHKVRELSAKKQELETENEELRSRLINPEVVSALRSQLDLLTSQHKSISEIADKNSDQVISLEQTVKALHEEKDLLKSQNANLQNLIDIANTENEELRSRLINPEVVSVLQSDLLKAQQDVDTKQESIDILSDQLSALNIERKALHEKLDELSRQISNLELARVRDEKIALEALESANARLRDVQQESEAQSEARSQEIQSLIDERDKLQDSLNSLKLIANELTETNELQINQIANLENLVLNTKQLGEARSQQLLDVIQENQKLSESAIVLQEQKAILEAELRQAKEERIVLENKNAELKREIATLYNQYIEPNLNNGGDE